MCLLSFAAESDRFSYVGTIIQSLNIQADFATYYFLEK